MTQVEEDQDTFERAMEHWSARMKQSKADAIQQRQELSDLHSKISGLNDLKERVVNSYIRTNEFENAMETMQYMFRRLYANSQSPRTSTDQVLYTEHGFEEDMPERDRCRNVQTRFETPELPGIEEDEHYSAPPSKRGQGRISNDQRYAMQMAESRARAIWKKPRERITGHPLQVFGRSKPEHDSEISENEVESDSNEAGQTAYLGPSHNALDQDYA